MISSPKTTPSLPNALNEWSLICEAKKKNSEAIGILFQNHVSNVKRLLLSVIGPSDMIDDLSQDVFLHVFKSIKSFKGHSSFKTWIHRITVNVAYGYIRKTKNLPVFEQNDSCPSTTERQTASVDAKRQLNDLYTILNALSPKRRIAFILFEFENYSMDEIAQVTGTNIQTIKSRLFFARQDILKHAQKSKRLMALIEELQGDANNGK